MEIGKIKFQKNGFLVNDAVFVPEASDNSDYQKIQKWIAEGGIVEPEFTTSEKKENLRQKLIASRVDYLSSTDFRVLRFIDEGLPYPDEIKDKRIQARQEINAIKATTTLTALNEFSEVFE